MTVGFTESCPVEDVRPRLNAGAAMLTALCILALAPTPARADDRVRVEGTFPVLYAYPSAVNYCVGGAETITFLFKRRVWEIFRVSARCSSPS